MGPLEASSLGDPSSRPAIGIVDKGSKFGTKARYTVVVVVAAAVPVVINLDASPLPKQVNDQLLPKETQTPLHESDVIVLGKAHVESSLVVVWEPLVLCLSSMPDNDKIKMKETLLKVGAHLVGGWKPECTHVLVDHTKAVKGRWIG